jgi:hypothetical protein
MQKVNPQKAAANHAAWEIWQDARRKAAAMNCEAV